MGLLKKLALIFLVLFTICFALLAYKDQPVVALTFIVWQSPELSVFWWLLAALVIGVLLGNLASLWLNLQVRLQNRQLRRANAELQAQLPTASSTATATPVASEKVDHLP